MSNVQSYNALIDRFKAFASGHFILKTFSHGQIDTADLEKFTEYPFMHVVPSNVTYAKGMKTFSFQIVLADLPRDKDDKVEFQREVLSDLQRIAEDLVAEITNHRVLFGDLITVQNVTLEPFLEEFHNTLTGWTVSLDLLVPYYWDACSIPAEWNDFFESSTGGTGSILTFIDTITRDENGNVSLVNDEAEPSPNYYYGTNDEGVRGWYLLTDEVGLTCATIGTCQTIIDIEAAIDDLQEEILLKANTADISAVGFSNDYNDLDNKPTIPSLTGYVPYTGATDNVDLGSFNLTADHIALNVSPSGPGYVVGATEWNNTLGSSQTLLKGGNVSLKNGVDLVARIVNKVSPNTTLTKAAYQAVRISGAQGGRLAVALAQANNDTNSADTIGIVTETIATNQEGFILTVGQLENINTTGSLQGETWVDGDVLYLSPTTAGRLTNIKPTGATGHIVVVGYVEYAHANNGSIYVKVMNGWELDELHNVYIDNPVNNNVLTYESSTSLWKNKTVATALGYTPANAATTLTINGTTQDLSANRTFTIASNQGTVTSVAALTLGTTGTDLSSTVANSTSTPVITLNVPTASATNRGALSSTDWSTFNGKFTLPSLTSGSVLFSNGTTIAQNNANFFWDNTNNRLGIGTATFWGSVQQLIVGSATEGRLGVSNSARQGVYLGQISNVPQIFAYDYTANASRFLALNSFGGNVGIGTTTDAGFRLDVNGTARVQGNITGTGAVTITGAFNTQALSLHPSSGYATFSGNVTLPISGATFTSTSGTQIGLSYTSTFSPTSGTAVYSGFSIVNTINQTGGANGITRGLYINPTLTAAADFRAIENTAGKVCLNTSSGNTMIGTTTDAGFKLDVNGTARITGTGTTAATNAFTVRNSGAVQTFNVNDLGQVQIGRTTSINWTFSSNSLTSSQYAFIFSSNGSILTTGAGNGGVFGNNDGGKIADSGISTAQVASAVLEASSTTRGFLPPRMTTTQKNAIASPAAGLVVYDTTLGKLCVRTASAWETITSI